ncbi:mating type protein 1-2-1 [Niveomyces insectorum RCEF 264]|uniref:Mating type protein 1-2-1 n=1 Tax=Niveomyces insectorum RCEF 264 TaxID=1081102 RepID=A0A167W3Q7_9HYPO|nr:mating type protein 1-2-1 [Niveomyces insectorum RCEF 264]
MDVSQMSQLMYSINLNGTIISTVIDPNILAQFWAGLAIQLVPGNKMIGISGPTFRILDEGGKHFIAHNFASAISEAMVKFVIDGSGTHHDRYILAPASTFQPENLVSNAGGLDVWIPTGYPLSTANTVTGGNTETETSSSKTQSAPSSAIKIRRPPNAYILYRKDRHKAVKMSNPNLSNNEISVILGRQWNDESDSVRLHYHSMAVEIKRQVEVRHPHYKYNPRKSSEIRRRARGNHGVYTVQNQIISDAALEEQEQSTSANFAATTSMPTPPVEFEVPELDAFMSPTSDN